MTAYVVETTAAGPAAISVLEVIGPEAQEAVARTFGHDLVRPDRPLHTMIADADGELDDVVIAYRPPEESMTGWPHVEIQCHGSPAIVKRVRRALVAVGVKPAPRTFLLRTAVRNRRMTRLEEEAWLAAMSALTERAANELWGQRKALPEIAARIGDSRDRRLLLELLATQEHGRALRRPLRIAFVGEPNAGKSSLVNALAGRERVLVDPRPGTTRDAIEVPVAIDGIPLVLIDTAGLRETAESNEKDGIDTARRAVRRADLVFYLKDLTDSGPGLPIPGSFRIWTKADLAPGTESRPPGFCLSVVTGEHLSNLENELVCKARAAARITADGAFLFTPRQVKRAQELLDGSDSGWDQRWERWVWGRTR